jgi:hypothetical protein
MDVEAERVTRRTRINPTLKASGWSVMPAEVMDLTAVADRLDRRIEVASRHIERSSQAVLAKAFRGERSMAMQE